jgi:hypothetical protein
MHWSAHFEVGEQAGKSGGCARKPAGLRGAARRSAVLVHSRRDVPKGWETSADAAPAQSAIQACSAKPKRDLVVRRFVMAARLTCSCLAAFNGEFRLGETIFEGGRHVVDLTQSAQPTRNWNS